MKQSSNTIFFPDPHEILIQLFLHILIQSSSVYKQKYQIKYVRAIIKKINTVFRICFSTIQ